MTNRALSTPEAAAGHQSAANSNSQEITDKRGYGLRWGFSVRHIDNLIAAGLPHLKIGPRRVRILIPEADNWMLETYSTQRRGSARKSKKGAHP